MPCKNAIDSNQTFSLCVLNLYGGKPSHGTCVNCDKCTDVEWHKQKVKEMLARQPQTPVSRIAAALVDIQPTPRDQWPRWASVLAEYATTEDAGIGDIVARKLGKTGEAFKAFMKSIGIDCGCQQRQEWLNQRYPLK